MAPLFEELRKSASLHYVAELEPVPLEDLNPEELHILFRALVVGEVDEMQIRQGFELLEDQLSLDIQTLGEDALETAMVEQETEILQALQDSDLTELKRILFSTPTHAEVPSKAAKPTKEAATSLSTKEETVKVSVSKLDVLVDLVGEMVIAQARLAEIAKRHEDSDLETVAEDLERMCSSMRDSTMDLRMLPIGTSFNRFKRLVRDTSQQLGKKIQLVLEGEDTELDKTVIDKMSEPMVHLIRNSLDHGIESPEQRNQTGKPEEGTIWLSARQSETNVIIEVRDDGKGLNPEKIRAKAIERGLISEGAQLPDEEVQNLVFEPGFSTADAVSALSGRGVGMDAVRAAVRSLRGEISLSSKVNEGTSFRIELPLTLAIIEGLLIQIDNSRFVLPLNQVEECIEIEESARQQCYTEIRGELVTHYSLRTWMGADPGQVAHPQVVVTHHEGKRFGFIVDAVVGQQQTVIKSLGEAYKSVEGVSGATILGDGQVALILDPLRIAATFEQPSLEAA